MSKKRLFGFNKNGLVVELDPETELELEEEKVEVSTKEIKTIAVRTPNRGIIQDSMTPILCHADGKMYDSKSEYRRTLKRHGMIEVGNELKDPDKRYKKESMAEIREKDRKLDQDIDRALAKFGIH